MPTSFTERQPLLSPQPKGVNIPPSHPAYEALQSARKNAAIPCDPSRTPAVGDSLTPVKATEDDEEEDAETAPTPAERRRSLLRWLAFWAVLTGFVTFLIVQAVRKGGGEFDWKGALKKAGGGGLAGGLAMVLQVLTLMPLRTVMKYVPHPPLNPRKWKGADLILDLFSSSQRTATNTDMGRRRLRRRRSYTMKEGGGGTMLD